MSGKVLSQPEERHVFQDDMESLLHVVFYCGLLHLPHNLPPKKLRPLMHEFFDRAFFFNGHLCGGMAKLANSFNRQFSREIKWTNPDVQTWLDAVMDMEGPIRNRHEFAPLWSDPEHLDTFWRAFLAERVLARDDRVENELSPPDPPSNEAPGSDVSFEHSRPRTERKTDEKSRAAPRSVVRTLKRQRTSETGDGPVRRSNKLRKRA